MSLATFVRSSSHCLLWAVAVCTLLQCGRPNRTLTDLEMDPFVKPMVSPEGGGGGWSPRQRIAHNNRIRISLFRAWTGVRPPVRASRQGTTVEGDPVNTYIIVAAPGTARVVSDSRKDRYARGEVGVFPIGGLRLGIRGPNGEFIPRDQTDGEIMELDGLILRYEFLPPNRGIEYF